MHPPTLFHLHLDTPDVTAAADRLAEVGLPLDRRFGSVGGEGVSLAPGDEVPEGFRFKLQVHQAGCANVTLAPGRIPHFDHLGLVVGDREATLARADVEGWSVRRDDRRSFCMTPWGFRVEVHEPGGAGIADLGDCADARLEEVTVQVSDADHVRDGFATVFGRVPELEVVEDDGPWVESFAVVTGARSAEVRVADLIGQP